MKVSELISALQKQDPEKEVMIQQGEEFDYMRVYSVRKKEFLMDNTMEIEQCVTIEYE